MKELVIRTLFLLDIPRDHSKGKGTDWQFSVARQGLLAISGSPSCPRLQVPSGLMRNACTDGEDRFGVTAPRPVRTSTNPVRLTAAHGGQDRQQRRSARLVQCRVRTAGRNRGTRV